MILSVVTEQHTGELKKKTFKVLCQFRVLLEWKKKGGHFEPLVSSLPHKRALVLDTGPAKIDLKSFYYYSRRTTSILPRERSEIIHARHNA